MIRIYGKKKVGKINGNIGFYAVIAGVSLFTALMFGTGCKNPQGMEVKAASNPEVVEPAPPPKPVEPPELTITNDVQPVVAAEVYSTGGDETSWFQGTSYENPNSKFSFKIGGTISEINYGVGSKILYERVLAKLDSTECQKKVDKIKNELGQAEVKALEAGVNMKKAGATGEEIKAARQAKMEAERDISEKRKELQAALVELGYHEIRFTQRGTVSAVNAKVGDKVEAGQVIIEFNLNDPLQVTVDVPAILLGQFGLGSLGRAKLEGNNGIYPTEVIEIGEWNLKPDGKVPVTVKLKNPYPNLRAGVNAKVAFKFDMRLRNSYFVVPPGSVGKDSTGQFVYVVKPQEGDIGIVEKRAVTVSYVNARGFAVKDGLKDGEIIVLNPIDFLKDGMKVKYK